MHFPIAVYRIQFGPSFGFRRAEDSIEYLFALGISDLYASPIFKARRGSTHGYDIVDQTQLNPELGSEEDFNSLITKLHKQPLYWIQDIVPNHMSFDSENTILMDVLENGPASAYYRFFDINWEHPYESMRGRVLAPFLGKFYAEALESGHIQLSYDENGLHVHYYDLHFPLCIESYKMVFGYNFPSLKEELGAEHPHVRELGCAIRTLETCCAEAGPEHYQRLQSVKDTLRQLYVNNETIRKMVDKYIRILNGEENNVESFNLLDDLLSVQMFRLSFWKVATEEINYRRFFNINELICLRMEDEDVFHYTHSLIFRLIREGKISGLRLDHIDGLYDPTQYLGRLKEHIGDTYVIVEKILMDKEKLPLFWPVHGTTGYEFLSYTNGLFCRRKNQRKFNRIYTKFSGIKMPFDELICAKKRLIIGKHMAGNIDNLSLFMKTTSAHSRYGKDITHYGLKRALVEVLSLFPVYRTYISGTHFSEKDRKHIKEAVKRAKLTNPGLLYELNFIEKFLLLESEHNFYNQEKEKLIEFVMKFQQVSGPLMAKGVEDTFFYVYNRFLPLNEVGSSPNKFGTYVNDFHSFNKQRQKLWPYALNTLSTHDTKRGEDTRARLNVLSEIPDIWEKELKQWHALNKQHKNLIRTLYAPDKNDEYFLYQTLVGALPFQGEEYADFIERLKVYIIKAVREAKVHTAWLKPDSDYENAYLNFAERLLDFSAANPFLERFLPFQKRVAYYGIFNSLSQTLIKITAPGVPDFYQGAELWDLSMVDPDNRRAVDYLKRQSYLTNIKEKAEKDIAGLILELLNTKEDGRIKLFLLHRALKVRTQYQEVFQKGRYVSLNTGGAFKEHVIAFARQYQDRWIVTAVPRFLTELVGEGEYPIGEAVWRDTYIAWPQEETSGWHHAITTEMIEGKKTLLLGDIFRTFPAALLVNEPKE